ncbi:PLP-dependent cysteine synthase family protein [Halosimplex aquaticum]|uniref:PLP-dependent cysteine synthase family protein n=1 Tax=Halosimplex aquaticum TaxID=3026162 RepID=A0ABD5XYX3_9EURY|nr:PLP-dependent cysteine synthase family protein [Halosimplex aquaticum]
MTAHSEPLDSVLATVGETPLVRVHAAPDAVPVYAKVESFNPGASVKDRIGRYMLEAMLDRGDLAPGGTVVEPTAGNTGIGMAIAAGQLDLEAVFVVPEKFSVEKQRLMAALGAEIVTTPTDDGIPGAIDRAYDIAAERENAVVPEQFSNPLNVEAHYETTAPEVFDALDGAVGAVVAGVGTAGTLMGLARYAREQDPAIHVVAVEPEGSEFATLLGGDSDDRDYLIEGIGTHDPERNELFDPDLVDEVRQVSDRAAHAELKRLATEEGHLVGSSAGAASVAARRVAEAIDGGEIDAPADSVATVFPDSSERYLSKDIYGSFEDWSEHT